MMFYRLRGKLIHQAPGVVVVECGGVGYKCLTTASTLSRLSQASGEVVVYTHLSVREDALDLFGFATPQELDTFRLLISVSGVGPKSALAVLSNLTPEQFALCVVSGDAKSLTKAQGIGPKAAQRIILELKDKISNEDLAGAVGQAAPAADFSSGNLGEAISALVVLGYTQSEAASAVGKLDSSLPVQELIRLALKNLSQNS